MPALDTAAAGAEPAAPSLHPLAELTGLAWLEALPVLLFARSADGARVWLSAHWLAAFGVHDLAALRAGWSARLEHGVDPLRLPAGRTRCRLRDTSGRLQPYAVSVTAAASGGPGAVAWLGVAEPQPAGEADFLAFAAHELRSPLNAIRGWSHVLRKSTGELNAMQEKALESIDRSVAAQARLIDDLLDRQRVLRGQAPLERQRIELAPLLAQAVRDVQAAAQEKSLDITLDVPAGLHADADPRRLAQALEQLLAHALKHTPPQGRIHLGACAVGEGARIEMGDGAQGFDDAALREALAQPAKGLGFAQALVELHGGHLAARADAAGTAFRIDLPAGAR